MKVRAEGATLRSRPSPKKKNQSPICVYWNIFSLLGGDITDLYSFTLADKPPIFLSQVDKSGGWWYMCPPWSWESYHAFPQTLQIYSTNLRLPFNPPQLTIFYICQSRSFFFLLPDYFPHICLPVMLSNPHCPKEFSSSSSSSCGHAVAVPPCGEATLQRG